MLNDIDLRILLLKPILSEVEEIFSFCKRDRIPASLITISGMTVLLILCNMGADETSSLVKTEENAWFKTSAHCDVGTETPSLLLRTISG